MSKQISKNRFLRSSRFQSVVAFLALAAGIPVVGMAANLNLSNNALEVVLNVESNIMILTDDSGSMGWGVMTPEPQGVAHLPADTGAGYWYVHPDPGATGAEPATNAWFYIVPTEEQIIADGGVAAPYGGVWRNWHFFYNKVYYNPHLTYPVWEGVDSAGNAYTNANSAAALYDPYYPANGSLDLTTNTTYTTDCGLAGCITATVSNFYPARYYGWADTNATTPANAGNGVMDADDDHLLVEIRSTTPNYPGRLAPIGDTGIGRSDCTDLGDGTATCTYAQEIQNFANWFSYFRKRDLTAKAAFSLAVKPAETVRIGIATINNAEADNLGVASMNISPASGAKKTLLDNLFAISPVGSTPLRVALKKTGNYYKCVTGNILGTTGSTPGSADCPVEAAPAGQCQQSHTILMTDGFWNGSNPAVGNSDGTDGDFGADYSNAGAFTDSHTNTLADVAMDFYKDDLHSTLTDEVSATARDIATYLGATNPFETMHQHMSTHTVGFGVNGTLPGNPGDPAVAFAWPNPITSTATKIDDLRHAAYNGRGQYLNAANPYLLVTAMQSIFNDIQTSTGTATAVAFNTQEIEAGTMVFRATFNTKTNKGDLTAQRYYVDTGVDPNIVWSAAEELDNKISSGSDTRVIITYQDTGTSSSAGVPFQWSDLTTGAGSQQALLDAPHPTNISVANNYGDERLGYIRGHSVNEGPIYNDGQFRDRVEVAGKLGDIVHSTPVFLGKPSYSTRNGGVYPQTAGQTYSDFADTYVNRAPVIYVGANDGMLHAFSGTDGSELFAYVPNIVIENLPDLTDPAYAHRYYIDSRPTLDDIYFTPARGTNSNTLSWNTVLVGGLAGGGKGYYALNVTNPNALDTEAEAKNNVMWEFTEADDGGVGSSDLGFTFSRPQIIMTNADDGSGNKVWVAVFGNGYNSTSADGDAALYMLRIEGGQDGVWTAGTDFLKASTGYGKAESADGTTPNGIGAVRSIDTDGNGTVDYVYAGDLQGNLYRFDLTSTTASDWAATPKVIFQARYKAGDAFARDIIQPITTRPIVTRHPTVASEFIVIVGTGSWMTTDDATSTDIQSIYGIWDDMGNTPLVTMNSVTNQLVEQVFSNEVNPQDGAIVGTQTNNPVDWRNVGAAGSKVKGWYIDLDVLVAGGSTVEFPGERAVRNILIRNGTLFVNTVIPRDVGACSTGIGGFTLAFNPETGGSGSNVIFDLDGDGEFTPTDNVDDTAGDANIVTRIASEGGILSDNTIIGNRLVNQTSDGDMGGFDFDPGDDPKTGRTSWREIIE